MRIKRPDSDCALRDFWYILDFARKRLEYCTEQGHDVVTILYISSLMISPYVIYNGKRLTEELTDIVDIAPSSSICVIRTTTPYHFPPRCTYRHKSRRCVSMRHLQQRAVNSLRRACYVILYDPMSEFLNHAKFLIYYHVCFSERVIHHGRYYGSTNLTTAGLAISRKLRRGNYEEYTIMAPREKVALHRRYDGYYLKEVLSLISHKNKLYTNVKYLQQFLDDHVNILNSVLRNSRRVLHSTPIKDLFFTYLDMLLVHDLTYALLDEIPGKKLTNSLIEELEKVKPPINIFELEMLLPTSGIDEKIITEELGLDAGILKDEISYFIHILEREVRICKIYLSKVIKWERFVIHEYFDDIEQEYVNFLKENFREHEKKLRRLLFKAGLSYRFP